MLTLVPQSMFFSLSLYYANTICNNICYLCPWICLFNKTCKSFSQSPSHFKYLKWLLEYSKTLAGLVDFSLLLQYGILKNLVTSMYLIKNIHWCYCCAYVENTENIIILNRTEQCTTIKSTLMSQDQKNLQTTNFLFDSVKLLWALTSH